MVPPCVWTDAQVPSTVSRSKPSHTIALGGHVAIEIAGASGARAASTVTGASETEEEVASTIGAPLSETPLRRSVETANEHAITSPALEKRDEAAIRERHAHQRT